MHSSPGFKAGTRASKLAVIQTRQALDALQRWLPSMACELVPLSSPGDRDRCTDLRDSPADFFTRDLDEAVLEGRLDLAVHSAKDLPDLMIDGLDWFWLPWRADPRDALVLRKGLSIATLPSRPRVGVSSERREAYARQRFPEAETRPIRGSIEQRLQQLDDGGYDLVIMAAAALERLGWLHRVTEWISTTELPPPQGQGALAVTYRMDNPRLNRLRSLFVTTARFVSAGAGNAGNCTLAGRRALEGADVCLYDTLMDARLLDFLPASARRMDVGKRCGDHKISQQDITKTLLDEIRRGRRVVRLKGGDAGLFGRLAEELEALDRHHLAYDVLPGVSSLTAATTGTGLLLTRRGVSRGFCVLTPRGAGGSVESFDSVARAALPIVFFMALGMADAVKRELLADGWSPDTPAAVVLDAGSATERVIRTPLAELPMAAAAAPPAAAGLLMVGAVCRYGTNQRSGALRGARVLLTCSEELLERAATAVTDAGGCPVRMPMLRLSPCDEARETLRDMSRYDWLALTSPSAARCFLACMDAAEHDLRRVPQLMTCGPGTADVLRAARLVPDLMPTTAYGREGLLQTARTTLKPGQRVLRLRSQKAGEKLARELTGLGAEVTDCVLYKNEPIPYDECPSCEAVFFASASAVEHFVSRGFSGRLQQAVIAAIGHPTAQALEQNGIHVDVTAAPSTVPGAIRGLARHFVAKEV